MPSPFFKGLGLGLSLFVLISCSPADEGLMDDGAGGTDFGIGGDAAVGGDFSAGGSFASGGDSNSGGASSGGLGVGGGLVTGGANVGGGFSVGGSNTGGVVGGGGALNTGGGDVSTGGLGSGADLATGGAGSGGDSSAGGSTGSGGVAGCGVPSNFAWTSSAALITPPSGSVSIKDPSILFHDGEWHIYATHYSNSYSMVHLSFADWAQAGSATKTPVSSNPNLTGYKCAPQFFYFTPQNLWYLVYQTQPPAYSTSTDPSNVNSWSAMKTFMPMPSIITNSDTGGIDYWVICDDSTCYLFFSADNGVLYRADTPKSEFPNGFEGSTVIVMQESKNALFEAANVYKIAGSDKYLLIHEAISNGRYFRSWTADSLDGSWTALADTLQNPFASVNNVTGANWSNDGISHGEMLRENPDETMTIDTCNMKYLFQGRTKAGSTYDLHEYSLGLLTAVQ